MGKIFWPLLAGYIIGYWVRDAGIKAEQSKPTPPTP